MNVRLIFYKDNKTNTKKEYEGHPKSRKFRQFGNRAMSYYPDRGYKRAVALFREELRLTGGLMDALVKVGYTENSRVLSPRQVRVIEEYLGESEE
jgi:hypothetical protein